MRQISRLLKHSRKAVRRVVDDTPVVTKKESAYDAHIPLIEEQLKRCNGNAYHKAL